jgi:hypothetical protein
MPGVILGQFRGCEMELQAPDNLYCIDTSHVSDFSWKLAIGDSKAGFNKVSGIH